MTGCAFVRMADDEDLRTRGGWEEELRVDILNMGEGFWFGSVDENVIWLPLCQTERGNKSWGDYKMCFIFYFIAFLGGGQGMSSCGSQQSVCGDAFMILFRALEDATASACFCGSFGCPGIPRWPSRQLPLLFLGPMQSEHL